MAVPAFDRAAMDGYALRGGETFGAGPYNPLEFDRRRRALPGRPFAGRVEPGQAVRIMTGAPLPAGADAVLPAEDAEEEGPAGCRVRVSEAVPPGRHVGRRGEDVAPGDRGTAGRPAAAAAGRGRAGVHRGGVGCCGPPAARRRRSSPGDELLPAGSKPEGYRIVDSNSVMLAALVRRDGGLPAVLPLVPDRREAVRAALLEPTPTCC